MRLPRPACFVQAPGCSAPHVGFSAAIRKIRARISLPTGFRPPTCLTPERLLFDRDSEVNVQDVPRTEVKHQQGATQRRCLLDRPTATLALIQYRRKPARCHSTTVRGVTRRRGVFHPDQSRRSRTQNSLCVAGSLGTFQRFFPLPAASSFDDFFRSIHIASD